MRALVITIFVYACDTWTLTTELQRRIQSLEFRCFQKILGISYKDRVTNEQICAENHHKAYRTVRRSPGNCKAAKTEMVWACDKIGWPNQSDATGNSRRQTNKGRPKKRWIDNIAEWTGKSFAETQLSHGTRPAGVERADEEVRHDAPLRLLADLVTQAWHGKKF